MKYGTMSYLCVSGKVLMLKKFKREDDPNSGFYTLPGGKLEDDERGQNSFGRLESAIRETEDETGLILINPLLRGIILFDNSERIFENWPNPEDFLVYLFSAQEYEGELRRSDEGVPVWIDEQSIDELPKNEGDSKIYEWLRDPKYFFGAIKHIGKSLNKKGTFVDYLD